VVAHNFDEAAADEVVCPEEPRRRRIRQSDHVVAVGEEDRVGQLGEQCPQTVALGRGRLGRGPVVGRLLGALPLRAEPQTWIPIA
jgi:hypothetical protein